MPSEAQALRFVEDWLNAWNARDLERILAHWAEDCMFTSPLVVKLLGDASGTVRGKPALRQYWRTGLAASPDLHFTLVRVLVGIDSLVIEYENHRGQRIAEMIRLGADGLACQGAVHVGLPATPEAAEPD